MSLKLQGTVGRIQSPCVQPELARSFK